MKLLFVAVKQVAKPVANRIKLQAIDGPTFRGLLVRMGQAIDYSTIQLNRIAEGQATLKRERVARLNEKDALARGADFLAEMVVYAFSAGVVGAEYWMSESSKRAAAAKLAAKEAHQLREKEANEELQWQEFRQLNRKVAELQDRLASVEAQAQRDDAERRGRQRWWR